jgi:hypothetical protein
MHQPNYQNQNIAMDIQGIFSQTFVGFLYARFIGPSQERLARQTDATHPVWERIVSRLRQYRNPPATETVWSEYGRGDLDSIYSLPQAVQSGLGQTANTYFRDLSKDIANIWSGDIFTKLLNYTICTILRLNLTPNKEQQARNIRQQKSQAHSSKTKAPASASTSTSGMAYLDLVARKGNQKVE